LIVDIALGYMKMQVNTGQSCCPRYCCACRGSRFNFSHQSRSDSYT
jgi:hypothetical protein